MNTTQNDQMAIRTLLMKLERNHDEIQQMLQKLNSYRCEPTSYESFKRLQSLRDEIQNLKQEHTLLFSTVDLRQVEDSAPLISRMRHQIQGFKELDRKIGSYLLDTKGY